MNSATLMNYYPKYAILDEILSHGNYDSMNIFIDLKNNLQTLYMQHAIEGLIESTNHSGRYDTSVVTSIFNFISFHKKYARKRDIKNINFYIFFETGSSIYHKNIRKKYKIRRKIDDLYGLSKKDRDLFFEILRRNYQIIEKVFNYLPNIKVVRLEKMEADFIPYYLITRDMINNSEHTVNVTYSSDHDLYQNLIDNNCFNFVKNKKKLSIIKKGEAIDKYIKKGISFPDEYLPVLMAIMGDSGDDVDGVPSIGPARAAEILEEVIELGGGIKNIYNNVRNKKPIFPENVDKFQNKYMRKAYEYEQKENLISDNLRLVSFEIISREFDSPSSTEMIDRKNKFLKIYNDNNKIVPFEMLTEGLNKLRIYVDTDIIETIYWN